MQPQGATLRLAVWSMLLASLFGLLIGICRISIQLLPRLLGGAYVEVMRNTPRDQVWYAVIQMKP